MKDWSHETYASQAKADQGAKSTSLKLIHLVELEITPFKRWFKIKTYYNNSNHYTCPNNSFQEKGRN